MYVLCRVGTRPIPCTAPAGAVDASGVDNQFPVVADATDNGAGAGGAGAAAGGVGFGGDDSDVHDDIVGDGDGLGNGLGDGNAADRSELAAAIAAAKRARGSGTVADEGDKPNAAHVLSTYEAMIATVNEMRRKRKAMSAKAQESKGACLASWYGTWWLWVWREVWGFVCFGFFVLLIVLREPNNAAFRRVSCRAHVCMRCLSCGGTNMCVRC